MYRGKDNRQGMRDRGQIRQRARMQANIEGVKKADSANERLAGFVMVLCIVILNRGITRYY